MGVLRAWPSGRAFFHLSQNTVMNIWDEFGQLGGNIVDTAGDLIGGWGDNVTAQAAANMANVETARARTELAKAAFVREQARKDKMQEAVTTVVYSALVFAGLALVFYFLKQFKK